MSAIQIAAVLGEDYRQGFERRLLALHRAKYLDRPANQEAYRLSPAGRINGRLHLVYAVGDRGAQLLAKTDGFKLSSSSWSRLNHEIKTTQINHALAALRASGRCSSPARMTGRWWIRWFIWRRSGLGSMNCH